MTPSHACHSSGPRPNFFLVGAPKCGTTSLYEYLRQHPQVFMPDIKEPHYFAKDLTRTASWHVGKWEDYIALFKEAGDAKRIGEGSVFYLYSKAALRELHQFNPGAKIIVMLRNPADMMYSQHGQFLSSGNEDIVDFEEALAAEPDRRAGRRIPLFSHSPEMLCYADSARYAEQVERYIATFGRENVLILLFDDLAADTPGVYRQTLEFLGVDTGFEPQFARCNSADGRTLRNLPARRILKEFPAVRMLTAMLPDAARGFLGNAMARVTKSKVERPTKLDPELRWRILSEFAPEIERLSRVIRRDLNSWFADTKRC